MIVAPPLLNFQDFLSGIRVDIQEIAEYMKKLKPELSGRADSILSFIIKGYGELVLPILKHVFNPSLSAW